MKAERRDRPAGFTIGVLIRIAVVLLAGAATSASATLRDILVARQIMADVFNAEVVTLKVGEGAAYGAALQALWCWRSQQGERVGIGEITDEFVKLNAAETARPDPARVKTYAALQSLQDETSRALRGVFGAHRELVTGGV